MGILIDVLVAFLITVLIFIAIFILILILPVFYDVNFKSDCDISTLLAKIDLLFGIISIRIINNNKQMVLFGVFKFDLANRNIEEDNVEMCDDEIIQTSDTEEFNKSNKSKIRRFKIAIYKMEAKCKESAYKFKKTVKNATEYKFKLELIKKTIEYIQKIINLVKPKKSDINITFGTGNAALNGKLMGAFAILRTKYPNVNIKSDFEKKILLLDVDMQGNMTLIRLIIIGIKYLYEKPIKELRRMSKKGGKHGKKRRR